jgi:hypothetical protein
MILNTNFDANNLSLPRYSKKDIKETYAFMKYIFPEEIKEYEEGKMNNDFVEDDCLETRNITFENIFTNVDENGKIQLFVYLDEEKTKKEYLFNFNMNNNMDMTIKYDDKVPIFIDFYNEEKGGNLKCTISWDMYVCIFKKDEKMIKKQIEAILYDIEDYSKNYYKMLSDYEYYTSSPQYEFKKQIQLDIEESKNYDLKLESELMDYEDNSENDY